ncbi:hypothetical protein O6B97_04015 [Campylobacter ureolyticus]|uniref:hypothetical protein n=1 Tax=Campylobacter ureolyticus TaxID=827 RepID=UPI0022B5C014|nr:hypothetical protein [Campylobacter ureolyticus]MCZ6132358.1 hypothetical protein [Campylobacter ureolyticus]MCZ6186258.1 hypothetical protein [Campylobacter ureolyticus]
MQTISSMQRNSRDKYTLKNLVFWVFLFFYEILTSIYTSLPPFIGLFFAYAVILKYEKDKNYEDFTSKWYQTIIFLFFAEQLHGFELFSIAISFCVFYYFIFKFSFEGFKLRNIFLTFLVFYGYISTFLVSNLISYFNSNQVLNLTYEYLMYAVFESAVCVLLFKDRII